jgi:hypothetical protein
MAANEQLRRVPPASGSQMPEVLAAAEPALPAHLQLAQRARGAAPRWGRALTGRP